MNAGCGRSHACRGTSGDYVGDMAIIYQAELSPTKPEVLRELLTSRPWGEDGELEVLGAYRFDDPSGEVGVECHLCLLYTSPSPRD